MKNAVLLSNVLLATAGVLGVAWYSISSESTFLPLLMYFILLSTVGVVGALAILFRNGAMCLSAKSISVVSLIILVMAGLFAFMVSPGSGAAALPFLLVVAGGNLLTLNYLRGCSRLLKT